MNYDLFCELRRLIRRAVRAEDRILTQCQGKHQFATLAQAAKAASRRPERRNPYRCQICHHWHVGHTRPKLTRDHSARVLADYGRRSGNSAELAMSDDPTRNLVFRFWALSPSQRRDIAEGLGLLENGDMRLPEPERYRRVLLRAKDRDLISAVAREIERREGR